MMGASKNVKREELLEARSLGIEKEFSRFVEEVIFEGGHEIERKARPLAEAILGEDLYPIVAVDADNFLSASFDGLNMSGTFGWECKSWNEAKAESVRRGKIPEEDFWQVVQQARISGASIMYSVTDGTEEKHVFTTYHYKPEDGARLIAGWLQFLSDVKSFQPVEQIDAIGAPLENLPALNVELTGEVTASNLTEYQNIVTARIRSISAELDTDQDFADAEVAMKFLSSGEAELKAVKKRALSQTASIEELFNTVDLLSEEMRAKRLELDKLVKARKKSIRAEIRDEGDLKIQEHIAEINERLGKLTLPLIDTYIAEAMKGKRTIATLRGAVSDEVARVKREASLLGDKMIAGRAVLQAQSEGFEFLFRDAADLVMKDAEDLIAVIKTRISDHKAELALKDEEERKAREAREAQAAKCDGNHAEPACADPECWIDGEPAHTPQPAAARRSGGGEGGGSARPARAHAPDPALPTREQILHAVGTRFGLSEEQSTNAIRKAFGVSE